jgi:hypothetical protein
VSELDQRIYGTGPRLAASNDEPLILKPARLPDPTKIAPRQWLLGTMLLRGFVTVLVAPGGTGKSIFAMTAALSLASGTKLLGQYVFERVNVAVINEDPIEELERRLAAIMIKHNVENDDVTGRYFLNSMDDRGILMAARSPDGFEVVHPDETALIKQIEQNKIGLLVVDPYAESHTLEENSNPDMIKAAAAWRRVARKTGCAIMLVHHVRKGAGDAGIDSARGAKGLTDSARVGLLMSPMSEDEAKALGVSSEHRFQHVRLDDGKLNLSPRVDKAKWFKLEQVQLNNGTSVHPNGDNVAAMVPWEPPSVFGQVTDEQVNLILDRIAAGYMPGILYTHSKRHPAIRWAGRAVLEIVDVSEEQAALMVSAWFKSGLLYETKFDHPETRKEVSGVLVLNSKRPGSC